MKIQRKSDNTFIIEFNGMPFHVTPEYPKAEQYGKEWTHAYISRYAETHPEDVEEYREPEPEPLTREEEIRNEIYRIETEYKTTRTIADAAMGNEWAINRLREAEELLKPLRAELAALSENQNK